MGVDVKIREIKEKCPKCGKDLIFEKNSTRSEDRLKCLCGWSITRVEAEKMKENPKSETEPKSNGPTVRNKCRKCGSEKNFGQWCPVCSAKPQGDGKKKKTKTNPSPVTPKGRQPQPDLLITRSPEQIIRMLQHGTALDVAKDLRAFADQLERKYV